MFVILRSFSRAGLGISTPPRRYPGRRLLTFLKEVSFPCRDTLPPLLLPVRRRLQSGLFAAFLAFRRLSVLPVVPVCFLSAFLAILDVVLSFLSLPLSLVLSVVLAVVLSAMFHVSNTVSENAMAPSHLYFQFLPISTFEFLLFACRSWGFHTTPEVPRPAPSDLF